MSGAGAGSGSSRKSRSWVTPKHKDPTQEAKDLNESEDLGSHSGTLAAKKVPRHQDIPTQAKFHHQWVMMHPTGRGGMIKSNATDPSDVNATVFASLVGFAISDICPLWRLQELTYQGKKQYVARTKFIRNFKTLEDVCRGRPEYDLIVQASKKPGNLAARKIPRFCALAKVLGNYDLPERNWGYSPVSGQVFMSDVDQSGTYLSLSSRPRISGVPVFPIQNSPLRFHTVAEMRDYPGSICIDTPYIREDADKAGNPFQDELSKKYADAVTRAASDESAVHQHLQTLFASTLLPASWVSMVQQQYLVTPQTGWGEDGSPQERFSDHIKRLHESLMCNPKFVAAFDRNRAEWLIEALAHFEKFNLHECRNGKNPALRIDLREVLSGVNALYPLALRTPQIPTFGVSESKGPGGVELSAEDEKLINAAEARGKHYFLLIKAKEYLLTLEGKTKFSLRSFPATARKLLWKLERGEITQKDWPQVMRDLQESLSKQSRFRQPITTEIYRALSTLISSTLNLDAHASSTPAGTPALPGPGTDATLPPGVSRMASVLSGPGRSTSVIGSLNTGPEGPRPSS